MINYKRVHKEEVMHPEVFYIKEEYIDNAIAYATNKIMEVAPDFVHVFPSASGVNNKYRKLEPATNVHGSNWTSGFWTGELWLAYELTHNEIYRAIAEAQYDDWSDRLENYRVLDHHDIGFLYIPSIVAQYKITGAKKARELGLKAADILANRYSDVARIIQVRDANTQGEFIIDCTMNIPLLFWAARETGNRSYFLKALNHIHRMTECMIRDDASTYQCYQIDEVTGEPVRGWTGQGYQDDSCWARGHSWAIYGLAVASSYVHDLDMLEMAKRLANYYLNRLPGDLICNWDLFFTGDDGERDTSTAPIVACGLLELSRCLKEDDPDKEFYYNAANAMIYYLHKKYTTKDIDSNALLVHGMYCHKGLGKDECCLWGDYFYMEALMRLKNPDWKMYW